jgi:hypothetical protein
MVQIFHLANLAPGLNKKLPNLQPVEFKACKALNWLATVFKEALKSTSSANKVQ